jgi:hypothetical protein
MVILVVNDAALDSRLHNATEPFLSAALAIVAGVVAGMAFGRRRIKGASTCRRSGPPDLRAGRSSSQAGLLPILITVLDRVTELLGAGEIRGDSGGDRTPRRANRLEMAPPNRPTTSPRRSPCSPTPASSRERWQHCRSRVKEGGDGDLSGHSAARAGRGLALRASRTGDRRHARDRRRHLPFVGAPWRCGCRRLLVGRRARRGSFAWRSRAEGPVRAFTRATWAIRTTACGSSAR